MSKLLRIRPNLWSTCLHSCSRPKSLVLFSNLVSRQFVVKVTTANSPTLWRKELANYTGKLASTPMSSFNEWRISAKKIFVTLTMSRKETIVHRPSYLNMKQMIIKLTTSTITSTVANWMSINQSSLIKLAELPQPLRCGVGFRHRRN